MTLAGRVAPAIVFAAAWAFRFLTTGALENDHFVSLARAHQLLHGAWPVRDFFDPGQPLTYLTSAAVAAAARPSLLAEVMLATTLLALATSVTFTLARRASGSVLIAFGASAMELAAYPRLYNAGKLLIPLVAVWLGWRYADRASMGRLVALAAWTAVACLWRHDLGIFVAGPALILLFCQHAASTSVVKRRMAQYSLLCAAFLLPWMAYVQWAAGLGFYLASASRFVAVEAQRTGRPDQIALVVLIAAMPLLAIGLAKRWPADARRGEAGGPPLTFAHIAFAATMALMLDVVFLRDAIAARLADVAGVSLVLVAWLIGRTPRTLVRMAAVAVAGTAAVAVAVVLARQGYGIPTPTGIVRRAHTVAGNLRSAAPEAVPDPALLPIVRYLASCTGPTERVLVSGFAPQIPVLADRPFAAGLPTWLAGYYTSNADVERSLAMLSRESVSLVVMLEGEAAFTTEWPRIANEFRTRGFVQREWPLGDRLVEVWLPASRADEECRKTA